MNGKILFVFGTRPEAIKMIPLVKRCLDEKLDIAVCVTSQHKEMLQQVLDLFDIKPDYDLDVMEARQSLSGLTIKILSRLRDVFSEYKPKLVLVHGDTTTAMVTSLAAFYEGIKVGHVEAGLRTYNSKSPFPEEANRQIVGVLADYHFAPTVYSRDNLVHEHKKEDSIIVVGNTVIDALFLTLKKIEESKDIRERIAQKFSQYGIDLNSRIILVTGHRRENLGEGFVNICEALKEVALNNRQVNIIYPVHLNPSVRESVYTVLSGIKNIFLIEPLGYEDFIYLMNKSHIIVTDSGGIQEEAPSLNKPVLVTRNTTERVEALESGAVKLVGTSKDRIVREIDQLLNNDEEYAKMATSSNPYGDGKASDKIVAFIKEKIKKDGENEKRV